MSWPTRLVDALTTLSAFGGQGAFVASVHSLTTGRDLLAVYWMAAALLLVKLTLDLLAVEAPR